MPVNSPPYVTNALRKDTKENTWSVLKLTLCSFVTDGVQITFEGAVEAAIQNTEGLKL